MDIQPDKQNIDKVFSNITYYIDFYQRDYKWTKKPVEILLNDIFYIFDNEYKKYQESDIEIEKLIEKFKWYYLNTYVTNKSEGKVYIVDGQQRLTTITLILIKLYHLSQQFNSDYTGWIESKIIGYDGPKKQFRMYHIKHLKTLEQIFNKAETIEINSGISAVNMRDNFKIIDKYLFTKLTDKHKFEVFTYYFMRRLVLVNLDVSQTDVPMVFEVINDRGVKLKPYEILKGKLLGEINKEELDNLNLNELWEKQIDKINNYFEDEADKFFTYYLRAKFANTRAEATKFDNKNYHRTIFETPLNLEHNAKEIKKFLQNDFLYFSNLYIKILNYFSTYNEKYKEIFFNRLNDMDTQFLLILSACKLNDKQEDEKIKLISKLVDKLYVLLQLQKAYDSNHFQEYIYKISSEIREKDNLEKISNIFAKYLKEILEIKKGKAIENEFEYSLFKETGFDLNKRFLRYIFARVDKFIADNINMKMKYSIEDLVIKTGAKTGFHIEHILSYNDENLKYFNDEEEFESYRNRLGALLLLKGRDNISSNNETYQNKLKTYANTLYWNEALREDFYKSKLDIKDFKNKYNLDLKPYNVFDKKAVEERHKLLFDIINNIWNKND
jgi:uncharacterized protein with ParB-like and HNH nuclease domain